MNAKLRDIESFRVDPDDALGRVNFLRVASLAYSGRVVSLDAGILNR